MNYYFSKELPGISHKEAIDKTKQALQNQGFGVIAEIDFQKTLKEKIDVDFRKYFVLEACSPLDAYKTLLAEDNIGLLLPCNLLVQEKEDGIEVSSIDPSIMMKALENEQLQEIAEDVTQRLRKVIESL
jgi:uncharacterized protein (DUF302 family)